MVVCLVSRHTHDDTTKRRPRNGTVGPEIAIFTTILGIKLVWILKFRQWFCRPSFETALAPEEIPWRIGGNSTPLFPIVVFVLPSDDQRDLNERGEGRALTPLRSMVKDDLNLFLDET